MEAAPGPELEATVTAGGDLVVPAHALRSLALTPGQRVRVRLTARPRRNMRGALRDQLPRLSDGDITQARQETWDGPVGQQ